METDTTIQQTEQQPEQPEQKCSKNLECSNNVLDLDSNICIVDLSYMTFTRFFAVRRWYEIKKKADDPDWTAPDDYDWMSDTEFMDKFDKLFFDKLFKLCRTKKIPQHNIIFAADCKHTDNWRVISEKSYKETRKDSHVKNKFHNFDIFPHVRHNLIRDLQEETRNIFLKDANLEADDIIAIIVSYLKSKDYKHHITIMANDKDYVQICNSRVDCCDISGKSLSQRILKDFSGAKEYLIYKILFGDISDNLLPCMFSQKFLKEAGVNTKKDYLKATATNIKKVFAKEDCYNLLMDYLEYARDIHNMEPVELSNKWYNKEAVFHIITQDRQFEANARMIDFANIDKTYKQRMLDVICQLF
jgi:5'-3' exonuclease